MAADPSEEFKELDATLTGIEGVLDVDGMRRRVDDLEQQAADPELWNDQARAQALTSKLSYLRGDLTRVEGLRSRIDDVQAALELGDDDLVAEAVVDLPALRQEISA